MEYIKGPISKEEFYLRLKSYGKVKVEYARKWLKEHGYNMPYKDAPIRVQVECDKYLDFIMGTEEAKIKVEEERSKQ